MTPWCSWRSVSYLMVVVLCSTQPMTLGTLTPCWFCLFILEASNGTENKLLSKNNNNQKKLSEGFQTLKVKWRELPKQQARAGNRLTKMDCRKLIDASATLMPPPTPTHTHTQTHKRRHSHTTPKTPTLNGSLAHIPNLSALTDGRDWSAKPGLLLSLLRAHLRQFVSHEPGDQRQPLTTLQRFSRVSGVCNKPPDGDVKRAWVDAAVTNKHGYEWGLALFVALLIISGAIVSASLESVRAR